MISRPAPEEPPMIETMRLGVIAIHRVIRFRSHFLILISKNPCNSCSDELWKWYIICIIIIIIHTYIHTCMMYCPAYVPVIVELCPDASNAIAYTIELDFPSTFCQCKRSEIFYLNHCQWYQIKPMIHIPWVEMKPNWGWDCCIYRHHLARGFCRNTRCQRRR